MVSLLKKVLIIDDEYHSRLLLEEILEEYDESLEIMWAEFGSEGFEIIKREKPDIIFLDVFLPVMNGNEICRKIKEDPCLKTISVVLTSARNIELDQLHRSKICADAYIQKPFSMKKVFKILEQILKKGKL